MKEASLRSVAGSAYGCEDYIDERLDSAECQTRERIELLTAFGIHGFKRYRPLSYLCVF